VSLVPANGLGCFIYDGEVSGCGIFEVLSCCLLVVTEGNQKHESDKAVVWESHEGGCRIMQVSSTVTQLVLSILLQECDLCLRLLVCWQKDHLHCLNDCGHSLLPGRHWYFRYFLFLCSFMPLCAVSMFNNCNCE
jgi:hypothetical protein